MKKNKNIENFSNKEWETLASIISEERSLNSGASDLSLPDDEYYTVNQWKQLNSMDNKVNIDVDKAWSNLNSRISEVVETEGKTVNLIFSYHFLRIAAAIIILAGLGLASLYLYNGSAGKMLTAETGFDQKNLEVILSDGSKVILNHNTKLIYPSKFKGENRKVELVGEALFAIVPDPSKPFIIDAGKAAVKVLGTTFNVITKNDNDATEVFVKSGKVQVTDIIGNQSMTLEPGYLGKINIDKSEKYLNTDPNYLAWNTNVLVYDRQKLDVVFKDLKRVYNLDIAADDPEILDIPLSTTFEIPSTTIDNQSQEDIIMTICVAFNLDNRKDGNTYHLSLK
jgi:transmembrane sensor